MNCYLVYFFSLTMYRKSIQSSDHKIDILGKSCCGNSETFYDWRRLYYSHDF